MHKEEKLDLAISSPYDAATDDRYVDKKLFHLSGNKAFFALLTLFNAFRYDVIILGHINLSLIGYLIKLIFPHKQIILIAHGIEVWRPLSIFGRKMVAKADKILAVSEYTKAILCKQQNAKPEQIIVFHNTIDPNFQFPVHFTKPKYLLGRYGIKSTDKVIITIARLSATEQYKGYDQVIGAMGKMQNPSIIYLIGGKYDDEEEQRLKAIIEKNKLQNNVFLTGYVNEFELTDHYLLADLFIMPSKKEGFGIVFIEAMACGLQVVAGNKDGSVDALRNGELGYLVNPDDIDEIEKTIIIAIENPFTAEQKIILQQKVVEHFGYLAYKNRLAYILKTI